MSGLSLDYKQPTLTLEEKAPFNDKTSDDHVEATNLEEGAYDTSTKTESRFGYCNPINSISRKNTLLTVNGYLNGKSTYILIDSGSSGIFVSNTIVSTLDILV